MVSLPKQLFLISLLFAIIFGVCFSVYSKSFHEQNFLHAIVSFQKVSVTAEVADDEVLRIQGLSGRNSLKEGEGMWFDFKSDGYYSIWMKEMNFPIDIIWFDKNFQVISLKENATPESYPQIFTPTISGRFVLEVPAGFVKQHAVSLGEKVSVNKTP